VTVSSDRGTPTGNVSLTVDAGTPITQALLADGSSTFTIAGLSAGDHSLSASYDVQGNFEASTTTGTLTVNKAPVSFTIGNDSQTYGTPANLAADLQATIATGVNGQNLGISYSSLGDTTTAHVGGYDITGILANGTGLVSNYDVTLTAGTLTVNQFAVSYTIANDSQTFGTPANFAIDLGTVISTGVN